MELRTRIVTRPGRRTACLTTVLALFCAASFCTAAESGGAALKWETLPPLPDAHGFAGGFAGVSHGTLLFAGGANFPEQPPWEGGTKVWHDSVYALSEPDGQWQKLEQALPRPLAYGVSVTYGDRLICVGGNDSTQVYADVFSIEWTGDAIAIESLPPLPDPKYGMAGGLIGDKLYIAGGLDAPEGTGLALNSFHVLDLSSPEQGWQELTGWPGPPRHQAVSAVIGGQFYLIGGIEMVQKEDGGWTRKIPMLRDAYRYKPAGLGREENWERIADLPRAVAAAPSPAPQIGERHILVVGGVDDEAMRLAYGDQASHPGYPTDGLTYHTITDTWAPLGTFPDIAAPVCAPVVQWNGKWLILSGEVRPGVRSPKVLSVEAEHQSAGFHVLDWITLGTYLGLLVWMGFYFSKRESTTADFFVGGKRIPWWAVGLSIYGTQLSSISYVSGPAKVFDVGWLYFGAVLVIPLTAPVAIYCFMRFFRRLDVTSAYEYLEKRFSLGMRLFGSLSFIVFQLGRITVVLFIPALALSAVTGINLYVCIIAMGALSTLYTAMGGIEAVVWTDVVQVVLLLVGAVLCLVMILFQIPGGVSTFMQDAQAANQFRFYMPGWDITMPVIWVVVFGGFFHSIISYCADQTVVQRYLTTPDEKSAANAIWTNAAMVIPGSALTFLVGTALYVFFKNSPALLSPALKNDQIFPSYIALSLPPGLVGLMVAGIFAATMSTLDSSLNSIATAYVTDFYRRLGKQPDDHACLRFARRLVIVMGAVSIVIAIVTAMNQDKILSLWDYYLKVIGLLMGCLTGVFFLGIFTRKASTMAAWIGAAGGGAFLTYVAFFTKTHGYLYAPCGILATFGVGWVASLLIPQGSRDLTGLTMYTQQKGKAE